MDYGKRGVKKRQARLQAVGPRWGNKLGLFAIELIIIAVIGVGIMGAAAGIGMFKAVLDNSPTPDPNDVAPSGYSTFVYDAEGNQIAKLVAQNSNRIPITQDKVTDNIAHAFVAIEDKNFYVHNGIDISGIGRAIYKFIMSGFKTKQGASTIPQQLLKNTVFTGWMEEDGLSDQVKRKIQEQYLALELSKVLSKDEILLRYLNTINLGQNTLGVQAASQRYFNKDVTELTVSECAVIAGITKNPSKYNPISHPDANADRREAVLNAMLECGYITKDEYDEAMKDDVYSRIQAANQVVEKNETTSYFVDALTDQLYKDLLAAGYSENTAYSLLYSGGLKIYSTQDSRIQRIMDSVMTNEENFPANTDWLLSYQLTLTLPDGTSQSFSTEMFEKYFKENEDRGFDLLFPSPDEAKEKAEQYKELMMAEYNAEFQAERISVTPQPQISMVLMNQHNGEVLAMVGGRGTKEGSRTLNRATSSTRSPGSTFKVLATYAPGIDTGQLTLATVRNDAPFNYSDGTPVNNYDMSFGGLTSVRVGIQNSVNIVAVKNLTVITPQLGFDYLKNFGFTTLIENQEIGGEIKSDIVQSLTLGGLTKGVTCYEMTAAYASIANDGVYNAPKLYTKVLDRDGNVILDNTGDQSRRVLKETTAFLLTSAMKDVVNQGTGNQCKFPGMSIAGKTGTSNEYRDVWFAGFTPYYTCAIWEGYDNNIPMKGDNKTLHKKLWNLVMSQVHEGYEDPGLSPAPEGIVQATVCAKSGKLPIAGLCDGTLITEYFEEGTVPTETCDVHFTGAYCLYSNLPATECCPFKAEGVIEMIPVEPPVLQAGSAGVDENGNLNQIEIVPTTTIDPETGLEVPIGTHYCPHTWAFMESPDAEAQIQAQLVEMQQRAAAAAAAAAAAQPTN